MENLTKLFKLLELTRSQPQYGYALVGIHKHQLSNLAEHQYLVAVISWQLARGALRAGGKLDLAKVLEFSLMHDLGELFGGDISMPYAHVNPRARKLAKAFEAENHKFLAKFFSEDKNYFRKLAKEIMDAKTDEALISKIADYLEAPHYRLYSGNISQQDLALSMKKLKGFAGKVKDKITRAYLEKFLKVWEKDFFKNDQNNLIYGAPGRG